MAKLYKKDDTWKMDFVDANGVRHRKKIGRVNKRVAQEIFHDTLGKVARHEYMGCAK